MTAAEQGGPKLTMRQVEESILSDLELLGDGLNRMEYILGCARTAPGIPVEERTDDALVADCQVNTWLMAGWENDVLRLRTDSESHLVKGVLSLIEELYNGRSRAEVDGFSCTLLSCANLTGLLNGPQKKGLEHVLNTLHGEAKGADVHGNP